MYRIGLSFIRIVTKDQSDDQDPKPSQELQRAACLIPCSLPSPTENLMDVPVLDLSCHCTVPLPLASSSEPWISVHLERCLQWITAACGEWEKLSYVGYLVGRGREL